MPADIRLERGRRPPIHRGTPRGPFAGGFDVGTKIAHPDELQAFPAKRNRSPGRSLAIKDSSTEPRWRPRKY